MTKNFQAVGEYHTYKAQARDAANRRFACLHNLGMQLMRHAEAPERLLDEATLMQLFNDATLAEREMHAAVERANQAAALCGEVKIGVAQFAR